MGYCVNRYSGRIISSQEPTDCDQWENYYNEFDDIPDLLLDKEYEPNPDGTHTGTGKFNYKLAEQNKISMKTILLIIAAAAAAYFLYTKFKTKK